MKISKSTRELLVAEVENSYGNKQRLYYSIDSWDMAAGGGTVRELPWKPLIWERLD